MPMVMVMTGLHRGFTGRFFSLMPASSGVRPLFRLLHRQQAVTIFSHVFLPTFGNGHDMIERQFFSPKPVAAILAAVPVSRKNIDAGKFDGAMTVFQFRPASAVA